MADGLGTAGGVVSAVDHRLNQAGLIAPQTSTLAVRTGVMVGPGSTALVTGTSATGTMTYSIAAHHWVTTRGTADGVYLGTKEASTTVATTAAPGANSRIDVIWSKQQDAGSTLSPDGSTAEQYGVTQGTAAASPTKPAIPVGAEEIATATVAAGATSTNGAGVTITNTARQVSARGARIWVRNQAERDALTAFPGLEVYRIDTGNVELSNGSAWEDTTDRITPLLGLNLIREGVALAPFAAAFPASGNVIVKMSNFNGTSTSSGTLTVPFPSAFPNGVLTVLPAPVSTATQIPFNGRTAITKTGFTVVCFGATGALAANSPIDITYLAIGW